MKIPSCKGCGACCAYGKDWVEVTEEDLKVVPPQYVTETDPSLDWEHRYRPKYAMVTTVTANPELKPIPDPHCGGQRCLALVGTIGVDAYCSLYATNQRPALCSGLQPGDPECTWILGWYGLGRPW